MPRLVDMLAGGGWVLLALFGAQLLQRWRSGRARDRAIDQMIAANRKGPANRQQRRALQRQQAKGKRK